MVPCRHLTVSRTLALRSGAGFVGGVLPMVLMVVLPRQLPQMNPELVELLIVIALLAVVSYVLAVTLTKQRQLETAAQAQAREIRLLTETVPVVIFSVPPDHRSPHFYLSGGVEDLTGYPEQAFLEDPHLWRAVVHPDDQDTVWTAFMAQRSTRQPLDEEFRIVTAQDEVKWVRMKTVLVSDGVGGVDRANGFLEDITDRKEIETALREREAMLAKAEEIAGIGSYAWDMTTDILTWSDNMMRIAGLSREDRLGRLNDRAITMVHPDDREHVLSGIRTMIEQERTWPLEFRIVLPDGETRTLRSDAEFIRDGEGRPAKVIGLHYDVTERRAAEAAVAATRDFYERVLETVHEGIWVADANHTITYANQAAAEITGVRRTELVGMNLMKDFDADALREWRPMYQRACTGLQPVRYEVRIWLASGQAPYQSGWFVPLTREGRFDGMIGTVEDVTEQQEAGEALRRSEERFHRFMQYLPAATFIKDAAGHLLYANERFAETAGTPLADLLAGGVDGVMPDDIARQYREENRAVLERGELLESESRYPTPQGPRDWLTYKFPIPQGSALPLIGAVSIDITERKQTEARLRSALREKTVLLQEIHHRVKNNLAIVVSLLGLQAMTVDDETAQAALADSQKRIHAMARVHEQLYRSPDLAGVDMVSYVEALSSDLEASLGPAGLAFELDVEPLQLDIGAAIPCALILNELISNAIKHGFLHGADLRSHPHVLDEYVQPRVVVRLLRMGDTAEVAVCNNGQPLPASFSLERSDSLGLTLVQLLVQQLAGTLSVERDDGTTFVVRFPLSERDETIDDD